MNAPGRICPGSSRAAGDRQCNRLNSIGLSQIARFGKPAYTFARGSVISSSYPFTGGRLMGSKRTSRRDLLKGSAAVAGSLAALGQTPASGQTPTVAPEHDHAA